MAIQGNQIEIQFVSQGADKVEADLRALGAISGQATKELTALSKTLGISTAQAATLSKTLGLSGKELDTLAKRYRYLRDSGATATETFVALNRQLGINEQQYRDLEAVLKQSTTAQVNQTNATTQAANASAAQVLALQELNKVAGQVADAFKALAGGALDEFIRFDAAFTSVAAKAGVAKEELGFLEDAIIKVALATTQSPEGAALAADAYLALGGTTKEAAADLLSVAQLTDALASVGATTEKSAKAIRLGTSIFADFGLTAEDVGNKIALISDTSAVASSTGLDEFLQVFSKAGGLSAQLGVGIDSLLAQFATLRDAGQAPEVAATALKTLYGVILEDSEAIKALGVDVFDAGGKFRGIETIIRDLGEQGISTEQVITLFGARGVASAVALAQGYDKTQAAAQRLSGTTTELADKSATINSSLQGQLKLLEGSYQTALTQVGESLGNAFLPAVKAVLDLVNAFLQAPPAVKAFVAGVSGTGAILATAVAGITAYALALKAWQAAGVGVVLAETRAAIATGASTVAKNLATAATAQLTFSQNANAAATTAAAASTTAATVATGGLSAAMGTLNAALLAVAPALAVLAAGLALGDIGKTGRELEKFNTQIDELGKTSAAVFEDALDVVQDLKNTNAEIVAIQEKGLDADQKSLDLQREKVEVAKETLKGVDAEIKARQAVLAEIEAGKKGQSDVLFFNEQSKNAREAQAAAINAQLGELQVAKRLLQDQLAVSVSLQSAQRNIGGAETVETPEGDSALGDFQQARKEAETDYNDTRKRGQAEYARERQRSEQDFQDKQARDLEKFQEDRAKAEQDFREKSTADADKFQRKQAADLEKFNADRLKAERDFQEKAAADAETFRQQEADRELQFAQQVVEARANLEKQQAQELVDFRKRLEDERRAEEESAVDREIRRRTDLALAATAEERAALEAQYAEEDALLAKRIAAEKAASAEVEADRRRVIAEAAARGEFDQTATEQRRADEELAALQARQQEARSAFEEKQRQAAQEFATQQQTARAQFEAQQQASAADFARQQQEAEAEFTANQQAAQAEFTASQQQAAADFARQQQEAEAEFTASQQTAQEDFQKAQQRREEDFALQQRQAAEDFQKAQQRRQAEFNEQQRKKDLESAQDVADVASAEETSAAAAGFEALTGGTQPAARRHGGPVQAGTPYLVGEAGPELLVPKTNGVILPNPVTQRILAQSPGGLPSGVANNAGLLREINAGIRDLQATIANRPIQFNEGSFTAVNAPDPLAAQIALTQAKLKALRGAV